MQTNRKRNKWVASYTSSKDEKVFYTFPVKIDSFEVEGTNVRTFVALYLRFYA